MNRKKRTLLFAGSLAGLLAFTACANPSAQNSGEKVPSPDTSDIKVVAELAARVPAEIRSRGNISFAATGANLPIQYVDESGELTGAQVDLIKAIGKVLDIPVKFDVVTNDAFGPGLDSGRYDTLTRGDNAERQKTMDFIDTFMNGFSAVAHSDFAEDDIDYKTKLCGVSTAVTKSTFTENMLTGLSKDCVDRGEPAIQISSYVDEAGVMLAVQSKQNDVAMIEIVIGLAYVAKNPDTLKMVDRDFGEDVGGYFSGFAFLKNNVEFRDLMRDALLHLAEVGTYEKIFESYGISELMLPDFPVNQVVP